MQRIPVGISTTSKHPNKKELNKWWISRTIPHSRPGLREALDKLEISEVQELMIKGFGLSLSDHYWMKPQDMLGLEWENINYFQNHFSDVVGERRCLIKGGSSQIPPRAL